MTSVATSGSRRGSEHHKAAEVGEHNRVAAQYLLGVVFLRRAEVNDAVREGKRLQKSDIMIVIGTTSILT